MSLITGASKLQFGSVQNPLNSQCPACLTEWPPEARVTQLVCRHLYCSSEGCLEQMIRAGGTGCALCRDRVSVNQHNARTVFAMLVQAGRHSVNPNSAPAPVVDQALFDNLEQHVHLHGSPEEKAALAKHHAVMAENERQEAIAKKILLAFAAIAGLAALGMGTYFYVRQNG